MKLNELQADQIWVPYAKDRNEQLDVGCWMGCAEDMMRGLGDKITGMQVQIEQIIERLEEMEEGLKLIPGGMEYENLENDFYQNAKRLTHEQESALPDPPPSSPSSETIEPSTPRVPYLEEILIPQSSNHMH